MREKDEEGLIDTIIQEIDTARVIEHSKGIWDAYSCLLWEAFTCIQCVCVCV